MKKNKKSRHEALTTIPTTEPRTTRETYFRGFLLGRLGAAGEAPKVTESSPMEMSAFCHAMRFGNHFRLLHAEVKKIRRSFSFTFLTGEDSYLPRPYLGDMEGAEDGLWAHGVLCRADGRELLTDGDNWAATSDALYDAWKCERDQLIAANWADPRIF